MRNLISHIIIGGVLGAIIGAVVLFILAEGLPEGAVAGALIGASVGALMAARIHAHRAAIAIAKRGPEEVQRQARQSDARSVAQLRERHHMRKSPGLNYLDSKLRDK